MPQSICDYVSRRRGVRNREGLFTMHLFKRAVCVVTVLVSVVFADGVANAQFISILQQKCNAFKSTQTPGGG